jgi:hypothetical protein
MDYDGGWTSKESPWEDKITPHPWDNLQRHFWTQALHALNCTQVFGTVYLTIFYNLLDAPTQQMV